MTANFSEHVFVARLALALGTSEESVRRAVNDGVEAVLGRPDCAVARLLSGDLEPGKEACIFFGPDGLSDNKTVKLLSDRSREEHNALVDSGATVRYAVCYRPSRSTAGGGVPPHLESRHGLAVWPPVTAASPGVDALSSTALACDVLTIDVRPSSLAMPSRKLADVIHRSTPAVTNAEGVVDQLRRGLSGVDVDGAAAAMCAWTVETLATIDAELDVGTAQAFAVFAESTVTPASRPTHCALQVVEALLMRATALDALYAKMTVESGVITALLNHGIGGGAATDRSDDPPYLGTASQCALRQRVALVHKAARDARRDVWCLAPLLRPLMAMKLFDSSCAQNVNSLATDVVEMTAVALLIGTLVATKPTILLTPTFFLLTLLPLITNDVVSQGAALLALSNGPFQPKELGLSPSRDVPAIDSAVAPHVLSESYMATMADVELLLRRWLAAVSAVTSIAQVPDFGTTASVLCDSAAVGASVSAAAYAADRVADLKRLALEFKNEGCGLLPPPVACLFGTVDHAAKCFPLLCAHQHLNWQLLHDTVLPRHRVLKYTTVDTDRRYAEAVSPIVPPPPITPGVATAESKATKSSAAVAGASDPVMAAAVDEERSLLRTRVVLLTSELAECRALLESLTRRVTVSEAAAATAVREAATLREELHRLRSAEQPSSAAAPPPPPAAADAAPL